MTIDSYRKYGLGPACDLCCPDGGDTWNHWYTTVIPSTANKNIELRLCHECEMLHGDKVGGWEPFAHAIGFKEYLTLVEGNDEMV